MEDGGEFECPACGHKLDEDQLVEILNEHITTKDNYFESSVPANCAECEGYHTVVLYKDEYLCVRCFNDVTELEYCGWCSEGNTGNMRGSNWSGCGFCEGQAGHIRDKDD